MTGPVDVDETPDGTEDEAARTQVSDEPVEAPEGSPGTSETSNSAFPTGPDARYDEPRIGGPMTEEKPQDETTETVEKHEVIKETEETTVTETTPDEPDTEGTEG